MGQRQERYGSLEGSVNQRHIGEKNSRFLTRCKIHERLIKDTANYIPDRIGSRSTIQDWIANGATREAGTVGQMPLALHVVCFQRALLIAK